MNPNLKPTLALTPLCPAAPAGGGTVEVLVRVQDPQRPEDLATRPRQPLRIAVVIDRSGSMSGEPLREALRCAEYIAAGLQAVDRLAVVLYDNTVQVAVPLSAGGDAARVRAALAAVDSGGKTALFAGWEAGAKCLEAAAAGTTSRVILLSDGQANEGVCDLGQIQTHSARWAARGITTTTVGLGRDFNEELMIGMASAGGGQNYYGQRAEDLHDSFDEELALLQSLFLRRVRVKLVPAANVVLETLGEVVPAPAGAYALPDVPWQSEAWMLVRLHVAGGLRADPREPQALLAATVEGDSELAHGPVQSHAMLSLPYLPQSDIEGLPVDPTVLQRIREVEFATSATRLHDLLTHGETGKAQALLSSLDGKVGDSPWLADKLAALQELMTRDAGLLAKEARYASLRMQRRLAGQSEAAYTASETDSRDIPRWLRRKPAEGLGPKRDS